MDLFLLSSIVHENMMGTNTIFYKSQVLILVKKGYTISLSMSLSYCSKTLLDFNFF